MASGCSEPKHCRTTPPCSTCSDGPASNTTPTTTRAWSTFTWTSHQPKPSPPPSRSDTALAAVHSIERLLKPRSIAVIGAGEKTGTIGHEVFANLIAGNFCGPVYPVHPSAQAVAGVKAYPTVTDVPDPVDLAVIAVPSNQVASVIEQCAEAGVQTAVVISAGFAEVDTDGGRKQGQVVRQAHGGGMRVVGPNCMGVINTAADVQMNATFAPVAPRPGRVAFASQSGGLGIAVLEEVARRGIGLSSFVSMGNKADVSGNDLLQYWAQDPDTDVILLYLESFGDARRFAPIARQASLHKPIIAVKAGRTASGQRAASSHTAALATPDAAVDALFAHTGVIRVDTLEDLLGVAQVVGSQPIPAGRRVAIVGNAGGPGILAADACESAGLHVAELSAATQAELRSFLPAAAGLTNPVDMVASASADDYLRTLRLVLADDDVDAVIAIFVPPLVTDADDVARAIATAASDTAKPVVASFVGVASPPDPLISPDVTVPNFSFPESAVRGPGPRQRLRPVAAPTPRPSRRLRRHRRRIRPSADPRSIGHPAARWLAGRRRRLPAPRHLSDRAPPRRDGGNRVRRRPGGVGHRISRRPESRSSRPATQDRQGRRPTRTEIGIRSRAGLRRDGTRSRRQHGRRVRTSHGRTRRRGHRRHRPRPRLRPAAHVRDRRHHRRTVRRPNPPGPARSPTPTPPNWSGPHEDRPCCSDTEDHRPSTSPASKTSS